MNTRQVQVSLWTLAALGFLAYYITVMWHEIIGHGATLYLAGARRFVLTSTSMHSPDVQLWGTDITLAARWVLISGALSNIALGLIVYPLFRFVTRRKASFTLRYFLWLLAALNFYLAFTYPIFSGIFGVADFAGAIVSLPHHAVLRTLEVVLGVLLCAAAVRFFAASFAGFSGNLWRLALIPYFSASLVFCLAGLRNPAGLGMMLLSVVPAALIGQSILLFVTPVARKLRVATPPAPSTNEVTANPAAVAIALVFAVLIFLTAPGIRFTVP